jgi:BMFP domain-containing protein YqiC
MAALAFVPAPASAQDVRGMQICTVEKQMERRTSCLQANVEFLQHALLKLGRETQAKIDSDDRALAATRAEIAALQTTVKKLEGELAKAQAKPGAASKK